MNFLTPRDAWLYALHQIEQNGTNLVTEDGQLIREILNLSLTIQNPLSGYPISGSGWDLPALDRYASQLLNKENPGFDYTYGNRLRAYECIFTDSDVGSLQTIKWDQINLIIGKLKKDKNTRRALAITWRPDRDIVADHSPCLIVLDFVIRQSKLYLTAFFRSQDLKRAWPSNVYGLAKLQEIIAHQVGIQTGPLTTMSVSAHYYIE